VYATPRLRIGSFSTAGTLGVCALPLPGTFSLMSAGLPIACTSTITVMGIEGMGAIRAGISAATLIRYSLSDFLS
jgi:hypothetical protein